LPQRARSIEIGVMAAGLRNAVGILECGVGNRDRDLGIGSHSFCTDTSLSFGEDVGALPGGA